MITRGLQEHIEKHRDENLPRLWQMNLDVVDRAIWKFSFVHRWNFEDYRQDAFIHTWKNYKYWYAKKLDMDFKLWLYLTVRQSVMTTRCKELHIKTDAIKGGSLQRDRYRNVENIELYDRIYEVYDSSLMDSLNKAIEALPAAQRKLIKMFLNDEDLKALSLSEGRGSAYYHTKLRHIVNRIRRDYRRYFEDIRPDRSVIEPNKTLDLRPVIQYDQEGNEIKRWNSAIEAEKVGGFDSTRIKKAATGELFSTCGFRWAYEGQSEVIIERQIIVRARRIIQLTLSGEKVRIWPSAKDAEMANLGFDASEIGLCVKGRSRQHKGYIWAYVGETDPARLSLRPKKTVAKQIRQLSDTGDVVKVWPSIREAVEAGFGEEGLRQCMKGKRPEYKGYKWQYAS